MIKAIIFDCFGVLTGDKWKEFCTTLPQGDVLQGARALNHAYDAGMLSKQEFLDGVHDLTGKTPDQVEDLISNEVSKNTQLLEYISKLSTKYKIGILSNIGTNWIRSQFLTHEEQALFTDMVFSFEVGMTKPDERIFQLAADRMQVEPDECVFLDDIEQYCSAARAIGMQAITYENYPQAQASLENILAG